MFSGVVSDTSLLVTSYQWCGVISIYTQGKKEGHDDDHHHTITIIPQGLSSFHIIIVTAFIGEGVCFVCLCEKAQK